MPPCHVAEDFTHLKEACPVKSVLLDFTAHCLSPLVHSHVLLGFMRMKLNLFVVLNAIEVSCLLYCFFSFVLILQWLIMLLAGVY